MSDFFWKKLNLYGTWIFIAVLFSFLGFLLSIEIKDFDLWLHLAVGKHIVQTGLIPEVDILSFTRQGVHWNNHEWLFQVIAYLSYLVAGTQGLVNMQTVVVMATVAILFMMGYNRERPLTPLLLLLLVILVYKSRLTHRPDLFSLFYFASYVFVLSSHLHKKWSLFALFFIQVLWVNTHGFFIFGPLMMLIGMAAEYVRRFIPLPFEWGRTGNLTKEEFVRLHVGFLVVSAACFVNPLFIEGVMYPLKIMFSLSGETKVFFENIVELQKPITKDNLFAMRPYFHFRLLILISAFSFMVNFKKIDVSALFMWAVFLIFSINAARNIVFFAVMAYFAVLVNMQYLDFSDNKIKVSEKIVCMLSLICKFVVGAWIFQLIFALGLNGYYDFDKMERKSAYDGKFSKRSHPYKAVDFLVEHKIQGNVLNDFNSGAYLIGRTHPAIKVFIDGRTELYGAKFFTEYKDLWLGDKKLLEKNLNQYPITAAFLHAGKTGVPAPLLQYFHKSKEWRLIYFNYDAAIYLKDIPSNQKWIEELEIDIEKWQVPEFDLLALGLTNVPGFQYALRARMLFNLNLLDLAEQEADMAITIHPREGFAYHTLGKIAMKRENYEEAFKKFRQAKLVFGNNMELRYDVAQAYYELKMYDKTQEQCDGALKINPKSSKFQIFCGLLDVQLERYEQGVNRIKDIKKIKPLYIEEVLEVADLLYDRGQIDLAREVYQVAQGVHDSHPKVLERMKRLEQ